jgi:hypothetical protein
MTELRPDDAIRIDLSRLHAEVSRYSYPLFSVDSRDRPDLYASCVAIECDGVAILITAAHAIFAITRTGSGVYIGTRRILRLPSDFVPSSPTGSDPLDIAAVRCPSDLLESDEVEVLPLTRTTLNPPTVDLQFHCIHGYPLSKNRQIKRIDPARRSFTRYGFTYAGVSGGTTVDYAKFKKDPAIHTSLVYERVGWNESGGLPREPPHPKGISGGGFWLVPLVPNSFDTDMPYLDGIAIEYHERSSLVFATRVDHVVDFLRRNLLTVNN